MKSPKDDPIYFNLFEISLNGTLKRGLLKLFIRNGHEIQIPCLDKLSGLLRNPDGLSGRGVCVSCPFGINKYVEHPHVEGTNYGYLSINFASALRIVERI